MTPIDPADIDSLVPSRAFAYRKDATDDGWRRCLAWFKENGAA